LAALLRFLLPIGLAIDAHNLGTVHRPIDERDDAGASLKICELSADPSFVIARGTIVTVNLNP